MRFEFPWIKILGINTCGENKTSPRTRCLKQNLRRLWHRQSTLYRVTILPPPPPYVWVPTRIGPRGVQLTCPLML